MSAGRSDALTGSANAGGLAEKVRQLIWGNFYQLVDEVKVLTMLPRPVQRMLGAARN
jgi:hypothetical protein